MLEFVLLGVYLRYLFYAEPMSDDEQEKLDLYTLIGFQAFVSLLHLHFHEPLSII